jgi:hypothetical protein
MALARYTYLPWLRRGAANAIAAPATASSRAVVDVSLTLNDGAVDGAPIQKSFKLMGPGDIIGCNQDLVVRTEPRAWVTDFEPNYLAFVDFYDEDFVWRHTPAPAGAHRLTPWVTLLVLAEGEFETSRTPDRPLSSVRVKVADPTTLFPPDDELWAWAHVQILGSVGGTQTVPDAPALEAKLAQSPDSGVCRLISARRLHPNTAYTAFVIPTFEVGRKAGLATKFDDKTESGTAIAWRTGATEFPVYFEWYFRTGEEGDFEDLVERMIPRPVDPRVGVRDLDIAAPGFGMPIVPVPIGPDHHEGVVGLEGALKAPTMQPKPLDAKSKFPQEATPIINAPAEAQAAGEADPVVAPPLYGGWHVLLDRVDPAPAEKGKWVNDLNLDPRERAAAGLGARVVRKGQEDYMKLAWEQVGEVLAANRKAALFRFSQKTAEKSFVKSVAALPDDRFLAMTAPVFSRVLGSPRTIRGLLSSSRLPEAALSPAFRKLARPRGLVVKRALPAEMRRDAATRMAKAINDGRASAAPPPPPVAGPTIDGVADAVQTGQDRDRSLARWGWWIVAALIVLALLAIVVAGAIGLIAAAAFVVGAVGVGIATVRAQQAVDSGAKLHLESLTPLAIPNTPPENFVLSAPGVISTATPSAAVSADFGTAAKQLATFIAAKVTPPAPRVAFDLVNARTKVMTAITPAVAFPKRAAAVIRIGDRSIIDYARDAYPAPPVPVTDRIVPVMAYPDMKDAMYKPLSDLSNDLFVPNIGLVPPNTISLMLTNPPFIESYMAGLNHEFARELLFREYPTDCRGTPFRQFWEVHTIPAKAGETAAQRAERLKDIPPLHKWGPTTPLGSHDQRAGTAGAEHVVLVIRGDLLKRYPNTIVYAQDAVWSTDPKHANELALYDEDGTKVLANVLDSKIHYPMFVAPVAPDLTFIGFDASLDMVRGDINLDETPEAKAKIAADKLGWFFVLQEVVGETRFGLDEHPPKPGMESNVMWDNLSWEDVAIPAGKQVISLAAPFAHTPTGSNPENLQWSPGKGATAADVAAILRQKPVLVGVHGRQMLERGKIDNNGNG